ncbi:MAG: hypothetical protein JXR94_22020 [Candidatus Hydrogenedentes bacterium]|nr:hypothetical protein [Candidatus Hydrogenedentota bacterium]
MMGDMARRMAWAVAGVWLAAAGWDAAAGADPAELLERRALEPAEMHERKGPTLRTEGDTVTLESGGEATAVYHGARVEKNEKGQTIIIADSVSYPFDGTTVQLNGRSVNLASRYPKPGVSLRTAWSAAFEVFGAPVCLEWSCMDEDERNTPFPRTEGDVFRIRKNETLRSVLDAIVAESQGALEWTSLSGVLWVLPTGKDAAMESALDTPVSIALKGATPWEGLKRVVRAVNNAPGVKRTIACHPSCAENFTNPPPGFADGASVSLELHEVTAREALSAVIAQSPVEMYVEYSNMSLWRGKERLRGPRVANLYIWVMEDGKRMPKRSDMTAEQFDWWRREVIETYLPFGVSAE